MPHFDSNTLQQAINLLSRTFEHLNSKRGEDKKGEKTKLQEDIESFMLIQSEPKCTFYDKEYIF